MTRHRFFLASPLSASDGSAAQLPLSADDVHHAVSVLRIRTGEEIDVAEPDGTAWRVRVNEASSEGVVAQVLERAEHKTVPHVTLVFGVLKGAKNDDLIEGACEVGVSEFLPLLCERSIVRLDADKWVERGARWSRVVRAAAKQSKRDSVPLVHDPMTLADAMPLLASNDLVLFAWEDAAYSHGIRAAIAEARLPVASRVAVVVGPEGGFTAEEVASLELIGAVPCSLGATILRAETAGVIATALVLHELGGLGSEHRVDV